MSFPDSQINLASLTLGRNTTLAPTRQLEMAIADPRPRAERISAYGT